MASVTRLDAYYNRYSPSDGWWVWNPVEEDTAIYGWLEENKAVAVKLADASSASGVITDISRTVKTLSSNSGGVVINIALFVNDDPTTYGTLSGALSHAVQVQQLSFGEATGFQYQDAVFTGLSAKANAAIYFLAYPGAEYQRNLTFEKYSSGGVTETTAPCAVTATSPKNVTRTATNSMSYSWQYVGDTAQASAEVQYWSGASWYSLGNVQGSSTTLSSSVRPPASSAAKWRVRVTDTRGNVSAWSEATYTLQYIATSYLKPYNSKTSGSINRFAAQTFAVQMYANGTPYHDYWVVDPVFYWRQSGETEWNSIQMTRQSVGGEYKRATVTIPANTFPKGTIQWYAQAGDGEIGGYGNTRTTSTYNLSTVAVPITATPIAPIDTVETANTPTVFTWRNSGIIQIYPVLAELQYSTDNVSWTNMGTVEGAGTSYTEPAGILPGGQIFWRIRVQNADGVWGDWSTPVSFENFGAPFVSNVVSDSCPFATITWSSSTQAAYKLIVDGRVYGPYWGETERSFQIPAPLPDGEHTVSVFVQNNYEQWSQPAETGVTVTNMPGASVDLTGSFVRDAALSWSCADETADFLIYRDDVLIGHTRGNSFTDRAALGYHSYSVLNRLPGGYYTASNVVSGTMNVDCLALAPLRGGAWVDLALSENSDDAVTYTETQQVSLRQFAGRDYPTAERSRYKTRVARFNAAWEHESADALAFEAMLGELVIYKHRDGRCFVGVLSAFELASKKFYKAYASSVQQSTWREYTDADS